jgi:hypothetical protein
VTPLEHALAYAARGWRVAPIPPGFKYPKNLTEWQREATTDVATITAWWSRTPDHGVSIVTGSASGIFVVDVDPRHGGDETLADLEHAHGKLPDTVETITGGGGRHLYFATPDGVTIATEAGKRLGPGLDVRGEGGQVVAPPTIHPDTHLAYEWEAMSSPFDGVTPAPAPGWLLELLTVDLTPPAPRRLERGLLTSSSDRPGDRFEAEIEWADLLSADGWTLHSARNGRQGDYELWTRPGKDIRDGASASLYYQGSDVLKVFTSSIPWLNVEATYSRFGYHAARHHNGDHRAAAQAIGRKYAMEAANMPAVMPGAAPAAGPSGPELSDSEKVVHRPSIVHNGRQLDDVTRDAIDALAGANTPPEYFVRAGQLARLRPDEDHRPLIEALRVEHARLALADAATWWRSLKDGGLTATSPPGDVATSVLARGSWPLPPLTGVVELPVLRPDGTFAVEHGYDEATRLYHWHTGEPYPAVPAAPTAAEMAAAVALVDEALCDFPWDTTADRANAWGLLLTPLLRPLVPQVPMALVDAPEPGTGKGLLTEVLALITMGRAASVMAWPTTEEEVEKKATAALMGGSTMIIWDNVEGMIKSGTLAAVLTADSWQGRVLGRSEMIMVPNRATWVATGNNIDVGGDLARRCYRIRLDARQAQPWKRTGFRHVNLKQWVAEHRHELLHALCTIVAGWNASGRPPAPALSAMGGYTVWAQIVGGVLEHAGISGFMANLDAFHADADQEARQWEAFLTSWTEWYGEQAVTTSELVAHVRDKMTGGPMHDAIPEDLAGHVEATNFAQRFGKALRRRTGRHYGAEGIHIVEMPRDRRQVAIWCVTTRSITLFDPDEPAGVRALPRDDDPLTWDNAEKRGSAGVVPLATREEFQEIFTLSDPDRSRDSRTPAVDELDEIGLL